MADTTPRLALPLIAAGQAQKELFHNEALALIDAALGACVEGAGLDAPPADARAGQCWIVGDAPVGAWAGQARAIACRTEGGWRFVPPAAGLAVWHRGDGDVSRCDGSVWERGVLRGASVTIAGRQVLGRQQAAIADPAGGNAADPQARQAILSILSALRAHGLIAG